MRGSPASEYRLAPSNTPDMNAGLGGERRRPLSDALKTHDGTSIASERQLSRRYPATSPDVAALMPDPALRAAGSRGDSLYRNGLVHDIRNILQILLSGVWVADERIREGSADEVPAILGEIRAAVDRASILLRNLLETPESRRCSVEIEKMLERLSASLRWALGPSNELVVAVGSDLQPVYCVESELDNVVLNLVINARDAMPDGGRVTIEATRSTVGPDGVVLRIHDTGHGMSHTVAAKAFVPYFTTKGAATGTGLGLAMVAAFADSIGGSARIEHTSAKGTTIALHLPSALRRR
jgi:signal transduction histidine kinase